jgi:RNA polymerase-binding transcription factor DksA
MEVIPDEPGLLTHLRSERDATLARIRAVSSEFDEIVAGSRDSNADDEHDPEGSTIAFERARTAALLEGARVRLDEVDRAIARMAEGTYGRCERCGDRISAERLAARRAAPWCVRCAAGQQRR